MSKLFQERNPARPLLKNSNAKELIFENPTKNKREKERSLIHSSRSRKARRQKFSGGEGFAPLWRKTVQSGLWWRRMP